MMLSLLLFPALSLFHYSCFSVVPLPDPSLDPFFASSMHPAPSLLSTIAENYSLVRYHDAGPLDPSLIPSISSAVPSDPSSSLLKAPWPLRPHSKLLDIAQQICRFVHLPRLLEMLLPFSHPPRSPSILLWGVVNLFLPCASLVHMLECPSNYQAWC